MARKKKSDDDSPEEVETFEAPVNLVDDSVPLVPEVVAKAPAPRREPAGPPPKVEKFRVKNGGRIMHRGTMTVMKPGKVVEARLFDLESLKQQGIELEPMN